MGTSQNVPAAASSAEERQIAIEIARWWWAWLAVGILWILASIVILQFRQASVTLVGLIVGIMFLLAGAQEIVMAFVSSGWKWLWATFGIILIIGGAYALFNPIQTFLAIADTLGFLFALVGIFWMIEGFATTSSNSLWWLGVISGFIMILLGFWAGGQFLGTQAYTLLIFSGIWALFHGVGDIIKAFSVKRIGSMIAA